MKTPFTDLLETHDTPLKELPCSIFNQLTGLEGFQGHAAAAEPAAPPKLRRGALEGHRGRRRRPRHPRRREEGAGGAGAAAAPVEGFAGEEVAHVRLHLRNMNDRAGSYNSKRALSNRSSMAI